MLANPITSIKQFILEIARESDLPFCCDIAPNPDWKPLSDHEVAGKKIPIFNQLTASEQWLFESIEAKFDNQKTGVRLYYGNMVHLIETQLKCTRDQAKAYLPQIVSGEIEDLPTVDPEVIEAEVEGEGKEVSALAKPAISETDLFDFRLKNTTEIEAFIRCSNEVPSDHVVNIFKVTIFMRQRVSAEWDFSNTMALFAGEKQEIIQLIRAETNGGAPEIIQVETDDSGVTDMDRKKKSASQTGKASTSKSKVAA